MFSTTIGQYSSPSIRIVKTKSHSKVGFQVVHSINAIDCDHR